MELIPNYDSWKLSNGLEDEVVVCWCDNCHGEIYKGETIYKGADFNVHYDCFLEYAIIHMGALVIEAGDISD